MISASRITSIFRKKGGDGPITRSANDLRPGQNDTLLRSIGDDIVLIVGFFSDNRWFAITSSRLVVQEGDKLKVTALEDVVAVKYPKSASDLAAGKVVGGTLVLSLRDGAMVKLEVESGKPYVGLLNVFMYIVSMNKLQPPQHSS
jgi:hypothetical protein